MSCSVPLKTDQCGLPLTLSHTDLQVQSENIGGEEALARDLQEEGELDHGTYAQIPQPPSREGSLSESSQSVPPLALSDPEVVTGRTWISRPGCIISLWGRGWGGWLDVILSSLMDLQHHSFPPEDSSGTTTSLPLLT